jgi:hypothetical protein
MATFQAQVEGLTSLSIGTTPTTTELTQFLTDGAKEIINQMPPYLLNLCSSTISVIAGTGVTVTTGKILNVTRPDGDIDQVCRMISIKQKGLAEDPDEMNYATITDPVYFIENSTLDILPIGATGGVE